MGGSYKNITAEALIVWDVVEEHFDEAAFLVATWRDALVAPNYTLDEVADRVEERLLANLEGLGIGKEVVAEKLLYPALTEAPDPGYATAAALVLLRTDDASNRDRVLDAILSTEGEQRDGLLLALVVSKNNGLEHTLKQRFDSAGSDDETAVWLSVMNQRRIHPGNHLKQCLSSSNNTLLVEAIRALGRHFTPSFGSRYARFIQQYLQSSEPMLQAAAVELGLLIGLPEAWQKCLELASRRAPNQVQYLEWIALLSSRGEFQLLFGLLQDPELQETALWCLGLTGSIASVEYCLAFLDDDNPRLAKLAFEAISHITGIDMEENAFQQDEELDDDEAILTGLNDEGPVLDPVEGLVLPNPDAIKAWWADRKPSFDLNQKYVIGEPLTAATLVKTLETGPMRLRNPLAFALWIRTEGQRFLSTHALSKQQYRELERLASLRESELSNYF